ncbi:uncharacterized protein FIBRA_08068 [Fibroporia radiculosa]|uniref:Uncharacterized protein n=1 Tax=Fibroporia radiculosa TaxID=599839 RepID=J4I223_9APHY|nr:uncharacterized protein FIBRA_08068 [Fibroporia radiculosa]CCM05832.1 predicted protein [Fibroporia radiculosa]
MDSFAEPRRLSAPISLAAVREQVCKLENDHRASGIPLSGRILHVCHYLPVVSSFIRKSPDLPSPPQTPPAITTDIPPSPVDVPPSADINANSLEQPQPFSTNAEDRNASWTLSVRYGHSAMVSGITSLAATHEQIVIGWTGDIASSPPLMPPASYGAPSTSGASESSLSTPAKIPTKDIGPEDRVVLEEQLARYRSRDEVTIEGGKPTTYIPVWLDDKEAHGHYEGYCKQTLWPLFHYLLWQDVATEYASADLYWPAYAAVNAAFAKRVAEVYRPGVDAERVAKDTLRPGIQPKLEALRALYEGKKIIVGRDKLDVVKGVVQKLRAFEKLLQDYPQWIGHVVLIQVTSPALSDSPKLERQVSELVAHINGEYGSLDFIPVHHYHQTIKKDEFYALLSVADLGVITPLRDGMNTTSMEFVLAQERTKHSPLVLSEFMGISSTMPDALQVNPWNLGEVADAMHRGLMMSEEDRLSRHQKLYKTVTTHTSHTWAAMLANMLLAQVGRQNMARQTPAMPRDRLESQYRSSKKRLFLLDYDGTLAPIVRVPSAAVPSLDTLEALERLTADPKNVVFIISGRDGEFLEQHLGHIQNLGMSAEHGGFVREPGHKEWSNFTESLDMDWMGEVLEIFRYYTERTTGSHIEVKKSSITWHYRSSDPEWGLFQCHQCQDLLENNLARKRPIEVLVGKKNLEVRPLAVNKGEIVKRILYHNPDAEFVFCAGDDKTDEDMFRALRLFPGDTTKVRLDAPLSVTLLAKEPTTTYEPVDLRLTHEGVFTTAVGHSSKRTLASWHVTSPEEVVEHLLNLGRITNELASSL